MSKLPIVRVPFSKVNPNFVSVLVDGQCMNAESYYLPKQMEDAEVLMLNINAGTMRVRLVEKTKFGTFDTDIVYFLNRYEIKERA